MNEPLVYLIHFQRPYRHAQHYLGWSDQLGRRLKRHRAGRGARLLAVVSAAGIGWHLVRVWFGPRAMERRLKRRHNGRRLCPICRA